MKVAQSKPVQYFVGLVLLFALIEVVLLTTPTVFSNLTERLKLKSAMFEFRDTTEVLFLGSSRFKDGISPKLVSKVLKENHNLDIKAFNGALTGTHIQKLETFFNKAIYKEGLQLVVIEVSFPHLFFDENYGTDEAAPEGVEEQLQNQIMGAFKTANWRKSFRIENFIKAPAIVAADYLEGSELYRAHLIKDLLDTTPYAYSDADKFMWQPAIVKPVGGTGDDGGDCVMHILQDISALARKQQVDILFVVPPLMSKRRLTENTAEAKLFYQTIANKTGHQIVHYGDLDLPTRIFSDQDSHMNKEGRHLFSNVMADLLSTIFQNQ